MPEFLAETYTPSEGLGAAAQGGRPGALKFTEEEQTS
jgi:hypothetical protein